MIVSVLLSQLVTLKQPPADTAALLIYKQMHQHIGLSFMCLSPSISISLRRIFMIVTFYCFQFDAQGCSGLGSFSVLFVLILCHAL